MKRPPKVKPEHGAAGSGAAGEALAAAGLRRAGYRVEARNLRTVHGEIDLLVRRGRCWIAVEVKARRDHPAPERCILPAQLDRLERALRALAPRLRPRPRELWVDAVSVRWGAPPEALHVPALRHVACSLDATGGSRRLPDRHDRQPNLLRTAPTFARFPTMAALSDQIIPRRKLLLMLSETLLFTVVLMIGTSLPPLTSRSYAFWRPDWELVRGLLTSITIAVICQASLSYNDLYDWKMSQNRAELPNRLLNA